MVITDRSVSSSSVRENGQPVQATIQTDLALFDPASNNGTPKHTGHQLRPPFPTATIDPVTVPQCSPTNSRPFFRREVNLQTSQRIGDSAVCVILYEVCPPTTITIINHRKPPSWEHASRLVIRITVCPWPCWARGVTSGQSHCTAQPGYR
jgi:hypothetical protein